MTTQDLSCSACGGPLTAPPGAARVTCGFCGVANDIASEGAIKVAKVLEKHGIRMPDNPRSVADIEADFAERAAAEEDKRRTAIVITVVLLAMVAIVIGLAMAFGS